MLILGAQLTDCNSSDGLCKLERLLNFKAGPSFQNYLCGNGNIECVSMEFLGQKKFHYFPPNMAHPEIKILNAAIIQRGEPMPEKLWKPPSPFNSM